MAGTTARVSILLPTHNRADVLGYAIQSVLSQTIRDFELLIVGDGCADGTRDVVGQFDDPRIKWFDLPKAPLSGYANRNIVLRQAVGSVVAYAQHDDLWFPDHLELLLDVMARTDAEWVYSRPLWIGPNGVVCPSAVNLTLSDELSLFMTTENNIPSSCVMHLRMALERVGYWPEDHVHVADWVCWKRMIHSAAKPGVGYCRVPTNLHFRAIWRDFESHVERTWRPLAHEPWWPPVLTHPPLGEPEQATLWRAMAEGGHWVNRVRDATQTVLDRMAWNAIRDLLPGLERAQAERAAAEIDACHARAETQKVRDVAAVRHTEIEMQREAALAEAAALRQACDAATVRHAELEGQREAALARARQSTAAAAQAEQDRTALELIRASTTWRATAPVRGAIDALKAMGTQAVRRRAKLGS